MPPKSTSAGLLRRTARKSVANDYPTPGYSPPSSSSSTNIATVVSSSSSTDIAIIPEPSRETSAVSYSPMTGPFPTINVSPIETTEVAGPDRSLVKSDVIVDTNKEKVNSIASELANFPFQTRIMNDRGSIEHVSCGGEGPRKVKRKVIRKTVKIVKKVIKRVPKRILIDGSGNQGEVERAGNYVSLTETIGSDLADDIIRKSFLLDRKTEKISSICDDNNIALDLNPAYQVIENCHTVTETANTSNMVDDVKGTLVEFDEEGNDLSGTDFVEAKITEINVEPHDMEHMVIANESNYTETCNTESNYVVSEVENELTDSADVEQVYYAPKCTTGSILAEEMGDSAVEDETEDSVMKTKNVDISCKEDTGPVEMNNVLLPEDSNGCPRKNENSNSEVGNHNVGSNEELFLSGEMGALERKKRRRTEIFVGGLNKNTNEGDIRKVFEEVGAITGVSLMLSNANGKTRSFAFVRFAAATDVKNALVKYSTVEICGTKCHTKPVDGNDTIFIHNINREWKTEDVVHLLEKAGIEKVDKVIVKADPSDGQRNRGFAFVEFETSCYAKRAFSKLQKKNTLFGNKQKIRVEWARPLIDPGEDELLKAKSVYVEHLTPSWDERKVKECFEKFGEIENIVLAKDLPLSKRRDFAFINYTTRDAALASIEAFSKRTSLDNGSQVKISVSLAKPICMSKQSKHASGLTMKQQSKEKPEVSKVDLNTKQHHKKKPKVSKATKEPINPRPASVKYNHTKLDTDNSTTEELVQLLRHQASSYHIPQHPIPDDHFPITGSKRQFHQGYVEPRGLPKARVESSYPSAMSHAPFPYHQEGPSFTSETVHGRNTYLSHVQMRDPAPYYGSNNMYRRY